MSARPRRRRVAAVLLAVGVTFAHVQLGGELLESRLGSGAADGRPKRIEVAFVRDLAPAAPPRVAAAAPKPRRVRAAPAPAASAPSEPAASAPEVALAPEPAPSPSPAPDPSAAPALAEAAAEPAAVSASAPEPAASAPPPFEWPPSTRLSYALTGNYRGPVEGQAQVEWLRSGRRYQVRFEVSIGPSLKPFVTRRFTSDGEITDAGLAPQRYDEEQQVVFRAPRALTIAFDEHRVRLSSGREFERPDGVQDTASQFVQLTWLFTTRPELLEPGRSVEIPLALPRSLSVWTYDVVERETFDFGFGPIETVHVKPRREPRPGVEMTVELWIAPSLQYLPVRSRIRIDAETFADLVIKRLPEQAGPGR